MSAPTPKALLMAGTSASNNLGTLSGGESNLSTQSIPNGGTSAHNNLGTPSGGESARNDGGAPVDGVTPNCGASVHDNLGTLESQRR